MTQTRLLSMSIESRGERWEHVRVARLSGRERVGQPFSFDVDVVCDADHELPEDARPAAEVTLVFERDGEEVRRVHGALDTIRTRLGGDERASHGLRLVPRAFRLSLVEMQEVFLDRSIVEIIRAKLTRQGFGDADFEMRLLGDYPPRELVTQYQESDLAFVSRLAEHVGISFFFEHEDGRDRMIFTDHPEGFRAAAAVPFSARREAGGVFGLERVTGQAPVSHIVHDYNYRSPLVDVSAFFDLASGTSGGVVEHGCHAKTPGEAAALARVRAEERRARQTVIEGASGAMELSAGRRVTIDDVPPAHAPEALFVFEVTHEAKLPVPGDDGGEGHYANTFRAVPQGFPYRPPRVTPRPRIEGVVTGIIQPGPEGETGGVARIDGEGRYTVRLHFDMAQPGAQADSHPIRMAQPFAGPSYGMHFPLRRGTEVLVAFVNGDPDRPVIVGALYNATSPNPVVAQSAHKHQIHSPTGVVFEFGSKS